MNINIKASLWAVGLLVVMPCLSRSLDASEIGGFLESPGKDTKSFIEFTEFLKKEFPTGLIEISSTHFDEKSKEDFKEELLFEFPGADFRYSSFKKTDPNSDKLFPFRLRKQGSNLFYSVDADGKTWQVFAKNLDDYLPRIGLLLSHVHTSTELEFGPFVGALKAALGKLDQSDLEQKMTAQVYAHHIADRTRMIQAEGKISVPSNGGILLFEKDGAGRIRSLTEFKNDRITNKITINVSHDSLFPVEIDELTTSPEQGLGKIFGMIFSRHKGQWIVAKVLSNSSSEKKGVKAGYSLIKLNDLDLNSVKREGLLEALAKINEGSFTFLDLEKKEITLTIKKEEYK